MDLEQSDYREYMYMEENWLYWYFSVHRRESLSTYLLWQKIFLYPFSDQNYIYWMMLKFLSEKKTHDNESFSVSKKLTIKIYTSSNTFTFFFKFHIPGWSVGRMNLFQKSPIIMLAYSQG